ncbi:MAG: cyclic nucleotide-binding domain-containing protein, partial [Deltaproteobacteria bacterium]|nr:cyclic nucleotide-binding domain-containing protein [Deltaproteobacteria bacterium]
PELGPGDDLGLEAVLAGTPHTVTVRALTPASVARLPRAELLRLCRERPALSVRLLAVLAERLHAERGLRQGRVVDLGRLRTEPSLWTLLPKAVMLKHRALPLVRHGGMLVVGFVDPTDLTAVDEVRRHLGSHRLRSVALDALGFERFFRACVVPALERSRPEAGGEERWFTALKQKSYELQPIEGTGETIASEERSRQVSGDQVIALLNRILGEALDLQASDIHIEPGEEALVIRYRIDGQLKKRPETLDMRFHSPLVSRIKVLGRMDIAERRRAQDGRMAVAYGSKEIDLRLATVPTRFGEKVVLRILDPASILIDLERLIPREPAYRAVRWMIEQPQGMVIVAGPTGSGKTTTIYSTLLRLREDEVNIVTIEDPIEYTIQGLTQVQVNEPAGVSFANAVRHFLRQDPDVIVVGETRDPLTARTSVEAALTGHLVLTSLHANDAVGTLVRLREMAIEPFLLANTVLGVVSQRLVRRICPHCRVPASYHASLIRPLGLPPAG